MNSPGDIIGERFEIERQIAITEMSTVFRAHDRQSGESVAVKVISHDTPRAAERFLRESRLLSTISHPSIVRYIAHGITPEGSLYLVTEWLDGLDLHDYLQSFQRSESVELSQDTFRDDGKPTLHTIHTVSEISPTNEDVITETLTVARRSYGFSVSECLTIARSLGSALTELHKLGIVHRDIKPSNIFLCNADVNKIKLLDLGTARQAEHDEGLTGTGIVVGTLQYMAPEQARARGAVGPAADIWALGCVLYRCLAGVPPFSGTDYFDILAKIVTQDPMPLSICRPDVPAELDVLIRRMMSKDPEERPSAASALVEEFDKLLDLYGDEALSYSSGEEGEQPVRHRIIDQEVRIQCMLFVKTPDSSLSDRDSLARVVKEYVGQLRRIDENTWIATAPGESIPMDQASILCDIAITCREVIPELRLAITIGSTLISHEYPDDEIIRWSSTVLPSIQSSDVVIDESIVSLLVPHFIVCQKGNHTFLLRKRGQEAIRPLFDTPTPWTGRRRELASLMATFDECIREEAVQVMLVTAPAGYGKTRLRYEFEQELTRRGGGVTILQGRGSKRYMNKPNTLLRNLLYNTADISEDEPDDSKLYKLRCRFAQTSSDSRAEGIVHWLAALTGISDENRLQAQQQANDSPVVGIQEMEKAWTDWLASECARGPVLIELEDLQWSDVTSINYIDAALRILQYKPLMVVAFARPEVHDAFPRLWAQRSVQELPLHPLSTKASAKLVRELLENRIDDNVVDAIAARAEGNFFCLEELIRAAASGSYDSWPTTVLAMAQARLYALSEDAKHIMRAASIFGDVFWESGVRALLSERSNTYNIRSWLDELTSTKLITRDVNTRIGGQAQYSFCQPLLREGAYATFSNEDRKVVHEVIGEWLERHGVQDPREVVEHFLRSEHPERAIPCVRRLARQSLKPGELSLLIELAGKLCLKALSADQIGYLRRVQAEASLLLGDHTSAEQYAEEALRIVVPGSGDWFRCADILIRVYGLSNNRSKCLSWFQQILHTQTVEDAEGERARCLLRSACPVIDYGELESADQAIALAKHSMENVAMLEVDVEVQLQLTQGYRAALGGNLYALLTDLDQAIEELEQDGDIVHACYERSKLAIYYAELGALEAAELMCREVIAQNQRFGLPRHIEYYANACLGVILIRTEGRLHEGRKLLAAASEKYINEGNWRNAAWTLSELAIADYMRGDLVQAEKSASQSVFCSQGMNALHAYGLAVHGQILLDQKQVTEALDAARRAVSLVEVLGGLFHWGFLPHLVLGKALREIGDIEGSRSAMIAAHRRLEQLAAQIEHEEWRVVYLSSWVSREVLAVAALYPA